MRRCLASRPLLNRLAGQLRRGALFQCPSLRSFCTMTLDASPTSKVVNLGHRPPANVHLDNPEAEAFAGEAIVKLREHAEALKVDPELDAATEGYYPENLADMDWRHALVLLNECFNLGIRVSQKFAVRVLNLLCKTGYVDRAEQVVEAVAAGRGGLTLTLPYFRTLLKHYVKKHMYHDAIRLYDVAKALLRDEELLWLHSYMMQLYDITDQMDQFEAVFTEASQSPLEQKLQICHMRLLESLIRRTNPQAVFELFEHLVVSQMQPVGPIMLRLMKYCQEQRLVQEGTAIYTGFLWPGYWDKRVYNFEIFKECSMYFLRLNPFYFEKLLALVPKGRHYLLLFFLEDPQWIEKVLEIALLEEGQVKHPIVAKSRLRQAVFREAWNEVVALYEQLPNGDTQAFATYLHAIRLTKGPEAVALVMYEQPHRFSLPAAAKVALEAFVDTQDAAAVLALLKIVLNAYYHGKGVNYAVVNSALLAVAQLSSLEDLESVFAELQTKFQKLLTPHAYLAISLGYLRHDQLKKSFEYLVAALSAADQGLLHRNHFVDALNVFFDKSAIRKTPQLLYHTSNKLPHRIYGSEARTILRVLRYQFRRHGIQIDAPVNDAPYYRFSQEYSAAYDWVLIEQMREEEAKEREADKAARLDSLFRNR